MSSSESKLSQAFIALEKLGSLPSLNTFLLGAMPIVLANSVLGQTEEDRSASDTQIVEQQVLSSAQGQDDAAAAQEKEEKNEPIEEVIVSIQRSLESALKAKRNSNNLIEVINAEDVGKLPDENVAEVLENIPGVQITRDGGIGSGVSIRGSDQNRIEINSRGTVGGGDQRGGIEISDLPAALIRSLNVVKVPTADMVEGSIGGTINVKTYRGLKLKERLEAFGVVVEYGDNSDGRNENLSFTWGDKFQTDFGDLGAILTVSRITKNIRSDSLEVRPAVRKRTSDRGAVDPPSEWDLDTGTEVDRTDDARDAYYFPSLSTTTYGLADRENNTFNGSLEWQAKDNVKIYLEGSYTDVNIFSQDQVAVASYAQRNIDGGDGFSGADDISMREQDGLPGATFGIVNVAGFDVPIFTSGTIGGGDCFCLNGAYGITEDNDGLRIRTTNRTGDLDRSSYQMALGGEWDASDNLLIEFEVNAAGAESEENSFSATFQYNDPNQSAFEFNSLGARLRVPFFYDARGGDLAFGPVPNTPRAAFLLDPDYYSLYAARSTANSFDNSASEQKMDFTWRLPDYDHLDSIKFGWRTSQRETERIRQSTTTPIFPFGSEAGFDEIDIRRFLVASPGGLMNFNDGGIYLDDFLTAGSQSMSTLRSLLVDGAGLSAAGGSNAPPQGFKVDENTYAGYLLANFDFMLGELPVSGNIGLRYVRTEQEAAGNQLNDDGSTFTPISVKQNYSNTLPSASLVFLPTEDIQVRLGYAKILRRPNFAELAPTFEYPLNVGQAVTVGNPELKPTEADQYDLTFEYYFRKGSALTLGYYYKDLKETIGRTNGERICNPVAIADDGDPCTGGQQGFLVDQILFDNLPGGRIQGIEAGIQHNFNWLPLPWRGFGFIANYAWQEGERDLYKNVPNFLDGTNNGDGALVFPLNFQRLSENSYNFTLYFERPRYRLSGRARYTYRDEFLISESSDAAFGQALYSEGRGQLNASMSYRLTDVFRFTFAGVNLLNETGKQRGVFPDGPLVRQTDTDRRLAFGFRARF